jgi:hypothetical protein
MARDAMNLLCFVPSGFSTGIVAGFPDREYIMESPFIMLARSLHYITCMPALSRPC